VVFHVSNQRRSVSVMVSFRTEDPFQQIVAGPRRTDSRIETETQQRPERARGVGLGVLCGITAIAGVDRLIEYRCVAPLGTFDTMQGIDIRNPAFYLEPYLAVSTWAGPPFSSHGFLSLDIPLNGDPIHCLSAHDFRRDLGILHAQTLLQLDLSVGAWLLPPRPVTAGTEDAVLLPIPAESDGSCVEHCGGSGMFPAHARPVDVVFHKEPARTEPTRPLIAPLAIGSPFARYSS